MLCSRMMDNSGCTVYMLVGINRLADENTNACIESVDFIYYDVSVAKNQTNWDSPLFDWSYKNK